MYMRFLLFVTEPPN